MILIEDIRNCSDVQVTRDEPGIMEFTFEVLIPVFGRIDPVRIIIEGPKIKNRLIPEKSSVKVFTREMVEVELPDEWNPDRKDGLAKSLEEFIISNTIPPDESPGTGAGSPQDVSPEALAVVTKLEEIADAGAKHIVVSLGGITNDDALRLIHHFHEVFFSRYLYYQKHEQQHSGYGAGGDQPADGAGGGAG